MVCIGMSSFTYITHTQHDMHWDVSICTDATLNMVCIGMSSFTYITHTQHGMHQDVSIYISNIHTQPAMIVMVMRVMLIILQRFSSGEILTPFLGKIAILKCFFFILLLRFFVGALTDWRQALCQHYFSASAFLHRLIQFMICHTASFSVMCYLHFLADFCWSASSSKLS